MGYDIERLFKDYSLETTAKDISSFTVHAEKISPHKIIAIPYLPSDSNELRIHAAQVLASSGFQPMPHFSARRIKSESDFHNLLNGVAKAGARRCLLIAGDPAQSLGCYADSLSLIETSAFEKAGITRLAIAGHPEGHPAMTRQETFEILARKCEAILRRGMTPEIITQFAFDADAVLHWLEQLRGMGIHHLVRLGVAGPASLKTLMRFAALCGVASSASVIAKYGLSLTNLLGSSGPEKFVARLLTELAPKHGVVHLHFYPFGGTEKTLNWIAKHHSA